MSKIDDLIKKYCPNGVEYKTFEDVCDYEQPSKYIVDSTDYSDEYTTPVLTAGQTFILGYTDEKNGIYPASKDCPVVIFDDFTGAFKWVDFPFKVKSSAMKILTAKNEILLRYVFHYMGVLNFASNEHKRLWIATYSKFQIPVPPLEVQREIVQVLDSFTMLTAELSAELSARKKQYEFYRDQLLSFKKVSPPLTLEWKTLGEICDMKAGKAISASDISLEQSKMFPYPCYGGNGIRGYVACNNQNGEYCLIGRQGALCGNVCFATGTFYATEHAVVVKNDARLNNRFLFHLLTAMNLNQYKSQGAQPGLAVGNLEKLSVPVPPIDIQKRIAKVLDNFEAICSDLKIGLPAEIELRKKQYEYYRDMLLSFEPIGAVLAKQASKQASKQAIISLYQYVYGYVEMSLSEFADIGTGSSNTNEFVEGGLYPFYVRSPEVLRKNEYEYDETAIITAGDGVGVGKVFHYVNGKYALHQRAYRIHITDENILPKYFYHYMRTKFYSYIMMEQFKASVQSIRRPMLNSFVVPIPSLAEQERIVAILDRFDALVNDISTGIPAEIEARKKQYEYYRDKLLTFPKVS